VSLLLESLRALCKAPGGAESIWEYLEAVVMATGMPGRFAYVFRTELHSADECGRNGLHNALNWNLYSFYISIYSVSLSDLVLNFNKD